MKEKLRISYMQRKELDEEFTEFQERQERILNFIEEKMLKFNELETEEDEEIEEQEEDEEEKEDDKVGEEHKEDEDIEEEEEQEDHNEDGDMHDDDDDENDKEGSKGGDIHDDDDDDEQGGKGGDMHGDYNNKEGSKGGDMHDDYDEQGRKGGDMHGDDNDKEGRKGGDDEHGTESENIEEHGTESEKNEVPSETPEKRSTPLSKTNEEKDGKDGTRQETAEITEDQEDQNMMDATQTAEIDEATIIAAQAVSHLDPKGMFPVEEDVLLLTQGEEPDKETYTSIDDLIDKLSETVFVKLEKGCYRIAPSELCSMRTNKTRRSNSQGTNSDYGKTFLRDSFPHPDDQEYMRCEIMSPTACYYVKNNITKMVQDLMVDFMRYMPDNLEVLCEEDKEYRKRSAEGRRHLSGNESKIGGQYAEKFGVYEKVWDIAKDEHHKEWRLSKEMKPLKRKRSS
ncbi:nuclear polyadenylated RNA-binding protein 3-like [Papaver somniferum]|uniref:nuclear polyadenylated RNA-binding protein 3-like n=1 Tax=Papaver somniferum TaxID=3469 RepID=UPI000E6FBCA3|nr:nuclear polyadenylated RNA-binding protein 3-like [Papaver somniferum]